MRQLVVGDTGPINYLVLIGFIDILPNLFEHVVLPEAVRRELCHPNAPQEVRAWMGQLPRWIEVRRVELPPDETLAGLGLGEAAAIMLATEIRADLLLMDERKGIAAAESRGLEVTGTLGVLVEAGSLRLLDLRDAFARLQRTSFRCSQALYDQLLADADPETGRSL